VTNTVCILNLLLSMAVSTGSTPSNMSKSLVKSFFIALLIALEKTYAERYALKMNLSKTKVVLFNAQPSPKMAFDGPPLSIMMAVFIRNLTSRFHLLTAQLTTR